MATHLARPHTHLSNRAKARSTLERKYVFRSVLENPFQINWPFVPVNIQNIVLARLVAALENIPPRVHTSRKFPHNSGVSGQGSVTITEEVEYSIVRSNSLRARASDQLSGASQHFIIGINEVTRALESQLHLARQRVVVHNPPPDNDQAPPCPPLVVVFVCYADVNPTALIDHIPYLVAGCNSPKNATPLIKLVPLPKGSEPTISQILGVRRAAVIAFQRGSPLFETVDDTMDSVPIISAPWLCPEDAQDTSHLLPTHIKQLRTTAPKDMRAAREQRVEAKAAAKSNTSNSFRPTRRKSRVKLTTVLESAA